MTIQVSNLAISVHIKRCDEESSPVKLSTNGRLVIVYKDVNAVTDMSEIGWWIVDPMKRIPDHGPYAVKRLAGEDRKGLQRTLKEIEREDT